jgi:lipopolysaccharide export LptBFGC system permease protein LptF
MISIIHRYIFRETFKVFALATVALSVILCLGMILRPVQDIGIGPRQVLHLIGYMMPITLTFVLPIAAL